MATVSIGNASYTEGQGAITLDPTANFVGSGVSSFSGGYLQFAIAGAVGAETLGLNTVQAPDTTLNAVSIVGSTVYLGTGSAASIFGSVDSTLDGLNGHALRINFSNAFQNGNFNAGNNGDTTIPGWTTGVVSRVQLDGIYQIAGQPTPVDTTYGRGNTTKDFTSGGSFTPSAALSDYDGSSTDLAIKLDTGANGINQSYGTIRGPYVYSNASVNLEAGDSLSFAWKTLSGGDAFDAYGYIININTGATITILNATGTSQQETAWATVTRTIAPAEAGTYRFVFVAGSFDLSGGRYLGSALMIDDVVVSQANAPVVNDAAIQAIARGVTYTDNAGGLTGSTRIVTMTVVDGAPTPATFSDTGDIAIVPPNRAPRFTSGGGADVAENGTGTVYTATGTDADANATLSYGLTGADATLFNIDSSTGAVSFRTAPNFEAPADAGQNNAYDIVITLTDGISIVFKDVVVTVNDVLECYVKQGSSAAVEVVADAYTGPVSGLVTQFLGGAFDDIVIGTEKADFINALGGDDAINGGGGNDVIDGGLGSNFLTGGAGTDKFLVDGRGAATGSTWSTITDFEAGENVTIWGNRPGVSKFSWVANDGTAGYKGATLHCDLDGNGTTDTSVTFAGLTQAQLPTPTYGIVQGVDYIFIG